MPRSRVGIFFNECTRSTPLDPKPTFWCVSYHLGAFGTVKLPYETRGKTFQTSAKFVPQRRVEVYHDKRTRSTPLDPKLMFWCVPYHFGAFGTIWLPYEIGARRAEQVQNFVPRSRVRIFRNERTRSTPLDPKLMFCCVSYHLGAFWTIWLPYETRCKRGQTSAKVCDTKSHWNFSQRMHPIHPIVP